MNFDKPGPKWIIVTLVATFLVAAQTAPAQAPFTLSTGWQFQDASKVTDAAETISQATYQPSNWYPAIVPGTILTSLVGAGVYPEPFYGINNLSIPDSLCLSSYWYRTAFVLPSSYAGKRTWINFNGINYSAYVWVNGSSAGTIKGAFARGYFDITSLVAVGGTNTVAVMVQPQPNPGAPHQKTIAGGVGSNGGVSAKDGPTFLCSIGWDWLPTIRDRNTGIWQDVSISNTGPVSIQNPYVTSQLPLPSTASADLIVQATVSNNTSSAQAGVLTVVIDGTNSFQQSVSLEASGTQTITFNPSNTPSLHILNPTLWWPNGYGPQNLHSLQISFSIANVVSDSKTVSFGIRQLSYVLASSTNLAISVNGVPVMCKGGNWGMDEGLKRNSRERLEAQIRMHQLANYTMIRNWVGQSTSEDFYQLCDQYGLLVWDEFFQPNPGDGADPIDTTLYLANVQEKVLRFRNHPCIALWCGRNEGNPTPAALATGIVSLLSLLDPGRYYQPNSNAGGGVASGGPYYWQDPAKLFGTLDPFKTEIGSPSIPTLESTQSMLPAAHWQIVNDDWAEHDLCSGAQQGDSYLPLLHSRYGPISSLADFVRKGQLANYEEFRAIYEGRFARLFDPCTGVLTWMSHPAHPSFVWQLYGWDLEPNASLFATRKACEPIHIEANQSTWHLLVINNTAQPLSGLTAVSSVYNLNGTLQATQTYSCAALASAATDLGAITFPSGLSAVHFVKLQLFNSQNQLLSDNFYWRETVPGNFQALDSLPMVTLNVEATRQAAGSNMIINATLTNPSSNIALMSHLQLRKATSGQRVLPVFYSDNYISLLPGESRSVVVTAAIADLSGDAPMLAVDGWNVTVDPSPDSADLVALTNNPSAQANSGVNTDLLPHYKVNAGGPPTDFFHFGPPYSYNGYPGFMMDNGFSNGSKATTRNAVNTTALNAAPQVVYQSERYGTFSYSFPVAYGAAYTVRLHFNESKYTSAGARQFNVAINGQQVLNNFDIFAAGGANTAVVREFAGNRPDANSNIVISFTPGLADQPKVCGIEIIPALTPLNLAWKQPVVASSTSSGLLPSYANDGSATTRWSSAYTDNEWIYVDLGTVTSIAGARLTWEAANASSFKIQVSNDATNWTDAYFTTSGTVGSQQIPLSANCRYVRMLGLKRATIYGYSLYEFEVISHLGAPFSEWQSRWFTPEQLANPAISSGTAAPAGDGISNAMKYALNLAPFGNAVSGMPVGGTVYIGGSEYLTLTYTQGIWATDISYIPEVSDDLKT